MQTLDVRNVRHGQRIGNVATLPCQPLVFLDAQQHMRRLAAVRDEDGTI